MPTIFDIIWEKSVQIGGSKPESMPLCIGFPPVIRLIQALKGLSSCRPGAFISTILDAKHVHLMLEDSLEGLTSRLEWLQISKIRDATQTFHQIVTHGH